MHSQEFNGVENLHSKVAAWLGLWFWLPSGMNITFIRIHAGQIVNTIFPLQWRYDTMPSEI
jgi:hypothetical protein